MLSSFKLCVFLFLLPRSSFGSASCFWLFVHIHKFLHTYTEENYYQAMIWLNFQRPFAIKRDGVNPALFHCNCLNYIKVFFFTFLSTIYSTKKESRYILSDATNCGHFWKDCGFCNYLFIFIMFLQTPKRPKPHPPTFG